MLNQLVYMLLTCTPRRTSFCTREYMPVCANSTTYSNLCNAESAGFYGNCSKFVKNGVCSTLEPRITCASHETMSEKGMCVTKPWSDFRSCEEEKRQGACPGSNDPNPWVGEHCATTCGVFVRTTRRNDGR